MMEVQFILTAFLLVFLGLTSSVQPNIQTNSNVQEYVHNLIDSIDRNDTKKSETYREILGQEAVREQQAFDNLKNQLRGPKRMNWKTGRAFKREANINAKEASTNSTDNGHIRPKVDASGKRIDEHDHGAISIHMHKAQMDAWINTLPDHQQQIGALKVHAEWSDRAVARENRLLNDLEAATTHVKRLACERNMRSAVHIFVKPHFTLSEEKWARQRELHVAIETRVKKFSEVVASLTIIIQLDRKATEVWKNQFETVLGLLRGWLSRGSELRNTTSGASETPTSLDLSTALTELSETTSTDEAIELYWKRQESLWKKLELTDDEAILRGLNKLMPKVIESDPDSLFGKAKNPNELAYVAGLGLLQDKIPLKKPGALYANNCTWVMLNSEQSEVKEIESDLAIHWPKKTRSSRIDAYCLRLSKWYEFLSDSDIHAPGSWSLPESFQPNTEDYKNYLKSIAAKVGYDDICTIGLILKGLYKKSDA